MIEFGLGFISGVLISILFMVASFRFHSKVERVLARASQIVLPEKVEFVPPMDEETEAMVDVIRQNDEKGIDTKYEG